MVGRGRPCQTGPMVGRRTFPKVTRRAVAGAALVCLGLSVCGPAWARPVVSPAGTTSLSQREASLIVDRVVVPAHAVRVRALSGSVFAHPAVVPACHPLVDATRYWKVPGSLAHVTDEFKAHPESALPQVGGGTIFHNGAITMMFITETGNNAKQMLDVSLASVGRGIVGVRADGLVIPPGSACSSSGAAHSG
jgi:hypothetical protein